MLIDVKYNNNNSESYELKCNEIDLKFLPIFKENMIFMDGDDIESWIDEINENYLRIKKCFVRLKKVKNC